jgi:hypothetical protein
MIAAILWLSLQAPPAPMPAAPQATQSLASQCPVSDDQDYAFTMPKAVQVGGGAMYAAARERRYLDALRGPGGIPIRYQRRGSTGIGPNPKTILDAYEVSYDGLEKPLVLYLDAYHFDDELKAPKGFVCVTKIALSDPGPDGFRTSENLVKVAIESGSADLAPIPLAADGSTTTGVAFDRYRLIARRARAAAAAGTPLSPRIEDQARLGDLGTLVIALPRVCDGKPVAPVKIDLAAVWPNGRQVPAEPQGAILSGDALTDLVPAYRVPPSAIGTMFRLESLRPNESITIAYAEPCGGSNSVTMPVRFTDAKLADFPSPTRPADTAGVGYVRLQAIIDPSSGAFREPSYVGGNEALLDAAARTVQQVWKVEPARINGAPIVWGVTLFVKFADK